MKKSGSKIAHTLKWIQPVNNPITYNLYETYELETFNHRNFKSSYDDNGGPFFLRKDGWTNVTPLNSQWGGAFGQIAPIYNVYEDSPSLNVKSDSTLKGLGTTAIARTLPTNPSFNAAQAIGELREGIPSMIGANALKKRSLRALNAGDEYLNVEFGWKPLISDIKKFCHAVKHSEKIVSSYKEDSGKSIPRRYVYPAVESSTSWTGSGYSLYFTGAFQVPGTGSASMVSKETTWFEGRFRYHLPVPDSTMGKLKEHAALANKVLGLRLTPELVWNLTPWSWMADWYGNTGDVLRNISALGQDGLVMQYGYIMSSQRKEVTRSHYLQGSPSNPWSTTDQYSCTTHFAEFKKRLPATPFGFNVDLNALTNKQIAIVAALGLSKGGKPWNEQK